MADNLRTAADAIAPDLAAWRRHLHAWPELSHEEVRTAAFIGTELRKLGLTPREHVGGTHGLIADIRVNDGPCVALRADMDALPIHEETGLDFASRNPGVMHACGHDAHVSMLVGAASLLMARRSELRQNVRLIFQPAEESGGGAEPMIQAGALDNATRAFGVHIWSEMPSGTIGTRPGPFMASPSALHVTVRGAGGHAAMPQQCVDPVVVAAQMILALQTVVSRSIGMADTAVLSVTQVHAGTATNIIPEQLELAGTIRTLSESTFATISRRVHEIIDGIARANGAQADLRIERGYPTLINNAESVEMLLAAAQAVGIGPDQIVHLPVQGGGEDFAYFAQRVPAAFAFLGARNEALGCCYPHHHARFNIDEGALPIGAALLASIALRASDIPS